MLFCLIQFTFALMNWKAYILLLNVLFTLVSPVVAQSSHHCTDAVESVQKMACHDHKQSDEEQDDCHCPPFCASCIGCLNAFFFPAPAQATQSIPLLKPSNNPNVAQYLFNQTYLEGIWQPPKNS